MTDVTQQVVDDERGTALLPKVGAHYRDVVREAIEQGARLRSEGKGRHSLKLLLPDGTLHPVSGTSGADPHGAQNFAQKLRHAGLTIGGRDASIVHLRDRLHPDDVLTWARSQQQPFTARQAAEALARDVGTVRHHIAALTTAGKLAIVARVKRNGATTPSYAYVEPKRDAPTEPRVVHTRKQIDAWVSMQSEGRAWTIDEFAEEIGGASHAVARQALQRLTQAGRIHVHRRVYKPGQRGQGSAVYMRGREPLPRQLVHDVANIAAPIAQPSTEVAPPQPAPTVAAYVRADVLAKLSEAAFAVAEAFDMWATIERSTS